MLWPRLWPPRFSPCRSPFARPASRNVSSIEQPSGELRQKLPAGQATHQGAADLYSAALAAWLANLGPPAPRLGQFTRPVPTLLGWIARGTALWRTTIFAFWGTFR